ncbi:MAG: cell envelope integrity protein CreD [Ignavibacteria bacterium]|nr:cell envelope integrity protein CreD [Ignavibacteria bacterium]
MNKSSLGLRLVLILFTVLVLSVIMLIIQGVIDDRASYKKKAEQNVAESWAGRQIMGGPVLVVETEQEGHSKNGSAVPEITKSYLLSDSSSVRAKMLPQIRHRGIYKIMVYQSEVSIEAFYSAQRIAPIIEKAAGGKMNSSLVEFSVTDSKGISGVVACTINGKNYEVTPGFPDTTLFSNGFSVNVKPEDLKNDMHISVKISLKGSMGMNFIPLSKYTEVSVEGNWGDPSFIGGFLPDSRDITNDFFHAGWKVSHFNLPYAPGWENNSINFTNTMFGVNLYQPVDEYQQATRSLKYGLLIILMTFVSFFLIEVFSKKPVHPIQYILVGLALILFYSLLTALSEYMQFQYAYLLCAVINIVLISQYVTSIYHAKREGFLIGVMLALVYTFMFVIIRLEDYSLLVGNIALFIVLGCIMYVTRKVDWFSILKSNEVNGKISNQNVSGNVPTGEMKEEDVK